MNMQYKPSDNTDEEYWKKQNDIRNKTFWDRYKSIYKEGFLIDNKITDKLEEVYKKISPSMGQYTSGEFHFTEEGNVVSLEPFHIMLGTIGGVVTEEIGNLIKMEKEKQNIELTGIKKELQKIERFLKYAIPDLEDLIECPHCKEYNPPDKKFCIQCNGQISSVVAKIKRDEGKNDDE